MRLKFIMTIGASICLCALPQPLLAQSGSWNAYQGNAEGGTPRASQTEETRTWNQEILTLETRTIAALLGQGYEPASVSLNYLSGNTEIYLSKPDGKPSLILCTLRTQAGSSDNRQTIATRCMAFN